MLRQRLPSAPISRILTAMGADTSDSGERSDQSDANSYRISGALTITRAASTQRELDSIADPLTIDLSEVEKMDTVGAWIVHRSVRDRRARVIGTSPEQQQLLEQVADADHPTRMRPEEPNSASRALGELGDWTVDAGRTLVGMLGFLGAVFIGIDRKSVV